MSILNHDDPRDKRPGPLSFEDELELQQQLEFFRTARKEVWERMLERLAENRKELTQEAAEAFNLAWLLSHEATVTYYVRRTADRKAAAQATAAAAAELGVPAEAIELLMPLTSANLP